MNCFLCDEAVIGDQLHHVCKAVQLSVSIGTQASAIGSIIQALIALQKRIDRLESGAGGFL